MRRGRGRQVSVTPQMWRGAHTWPPVQPNSEIAAALHLTEGTVRTYLSSAIAKLGARNRAEGANLGRNRG